MSRYSAYTLRIRLLAVCTFCVGCAQAPANAQAYPSEAATTDREAAADATAIELRLQDLEDSRDIAVLLASAKQTTSNKKAAWALTSQRPQGGVEPDEPEEGGSLQAEVLQPSVDETLAETLAQTPNSDGFTVPNDDPDLGTLRLYPQADVDTDLGVLRLQPAEDTPPRPPVVYATIQSSTILSDNALSSADPIEDGLLQAGIGLRAVPALGSQTFAVLTLNGNVVRYFDETDFNYDELEMGASIFHRITRRTYIDVGWKNEQLFRESGDRIISDHQLRASIGRQDQLGPVRIDTAYQLQRSFADPNSRSRLINRLSVGANYPVQSRIDLGIFYQLSLIDFIDGDRDDHYQQLIGQISYRPSSTTRISLFGGGRLGDSDLDFIDFNSALIGISVGVNLPLF